MIKITAKFLKSFDQKSKGLVGKEEIENVYFETRFGIHTFIMKKAIDVVILNDKSRVVKLKSGLQPNKIFLWNPRFYRVLELKKGEIIKKKIMQNSVLDLRLF